MSLAFASSIPVLGLERFCPRKGCPWPWTFLGPWPRALCPRLHLWYVLTCFRKKMICLVLCGVLVARNSLKTMTTDKLYQRIDYYCMLIYTQSLIWPATRPHYLLNFGSEKIGPRTIKLTFIMYIL